MIDIIWLNCVTIIVCKRLEHNNYYIGSEHSNQDINHKSLIYTWTSTTQGYNYHVL